MTEFLSTFPIYQLALAGLLTVTFVVQLIFWLRYRVVAVHRHPYRLKEGEPLPSVSVVIVVNEELDYLENDLPAIMSQDHPQFEVVVVNDCGGPEVDGALEILVRRYDNLRFTTIKTDKRFAHSRKIPLVVGIKACKYPNIIFANTNAVPAGDKWLSNMSKGFVGGSDLVIGYCGFEPEKGFQNAYIRCCRLGASIRYLRAAVSGRAYRGIYNNLGYTKDLFFENRGFTHLRMALGEDDLFVAKIADGRNTAVVINAASTMRQKAGGGLRWWWREERYRTFSFEFYPLRVKAGIFTELTTRFLLFVSAVLLGIFSGIDNNWLWTCAVLLLALRELVMWSTVRKIAKRLGEHKMMRTYMLYDFVAPVREAVLAVSRRLKPPAGIWK